MSWRDSPQRHGDFRKGEKEWARRGVKLLTHEAEAWEQVVAFIAGTVNAPSGGPSAQRPRGLCIKPGYASNRAMHQTGLCIKPGYASNRAMHQTGLCIKPGYASNRAMHQTGLCIKPGYASNRAMHQTGLCIKHRGFCRACDYFLMRVRQTRQSTSLRRGWNL